MNNFLSVENLYKSFYLDSKEIQVLKGVDFAVDRGEIISIVGASGAGKSTLLHLIGLLDTPSSGRIILNNEEVSGMDYRTLATIRNTRIGFIFQFHHLLPEFTALENVAIPAMIARKPYHDARENARILLDRMGLGNRINHKPGELSGGEQQRVAVARALVNNPDLILADEPTGNLDSITGQNIHELLTGLNQERNITMIIVSHNIQLAGIAHRGLKLVDGKLYPYDPSGSG